MKNSVFCKYISLVLFIMFCLSAKLVKADKQSIIEHNKFFDTEITFHDASGKKHFIEDYEGDTVLLVFWATWCGTCVDEMPKLDNLQKDFRKMPFKIIPISEDYRDVNLLKEYFAKYELRYLDIFRDINNYLMTELGIAGLPSAYLLDASGKLRLEFRGKIKWEDDNIRQIILEHIEGDYALPKNTFRHKKFFEEIDTEKFKDKQHEVKKNQK